MKLLTKHSGLIVGILSGALAGFFYWYFVGCNSGSCAITSSPYNSTIYGAVMGGLIFSLFKKEKKKEQTEIETKE